DLEICVLKSSSLVAARLLCSTGLFNSCELDTDLNNYTEYKRDIPRVQTTYWCPPQTIVIFNAAFLGFDPIEDVFIPPIDGQTIHISKEIQLNRDDIANLHLPRLAALLKGLARRYLDTRDDVAMIAVEQLVDGMNIDEVWVERQLKGSDAAILDLVMSQVRSKRLRIDYYTENKITCFISDEEEAKRERLNDAAIALHRVLSREQVAFDIFGGYAIATFGGPRESKDVDCIASASKDQIIQLLNGKQGFQAIPQSRQDYVALFWSDRADRGNAVLVEVFCEKFPGSHYTMGDVPCNTVSIKGSCLGEGMACFLDPFYLFKGKLRATATRAKFHDSADLRMLVGKYEGVLKSHAHELHLEYVGLSLKRYPELERLFEQLGVDIEQAKRAANGLDLNRLPAPAPGDVQRGLLG
ncbi:hypothetical protein EsDP_00007428, partial [Epichloe bromicola]